MAAIALGAVGLAFADFAAVWQPFPDDAPGRVVFAYATAALFLVSGALLQWRRTAGVGALLCAVLCATFAFFWLTMRLLAQPQMLALYNGVAEQLAMAMGGVVSYASLQQAAWAPRLTRVGGIVFGACCLTFGATHFVYLIETAAFVPAWIPPDTRTWAALTGAAHVAAGLALISGILAPLASRLLTAMFVGFGALVWAPQLFSASGEHMTWAGNAINLMLVGAAWVVADSFTPKAPPR